MKQAQFAKKRVCPVNERQIIHYALDECWQIGIIKYDPLVVTLQRRHNEQESVSNYRCLYCLLNRLFRHRSKKTSNLRVTGLCEGNSPVTGQFPADTIALHSIPNISHRLFTGPWFVVFHWCMVQVNFTHFFQSYISGTVAISSFTQCRCPEKLYFNGGFLTTSF